MCLLSSIFPQFLFLDLNLHLPCTYSIPQSPSIFCLHGPFCPFQGQLQKGMLVIAMDDTREGQRGHFSGFAGPSLSDWYMSPLTGGDGVRRVKFVCDQLEVPPATALLCVGGKHNRGIILYATIDATTLDPVFNVSIFCSSRTEFKFAFSSAKSHRFIAG